MRMTNIDVSIIIVNYDITSLVVNAIDSLFHKIKDLTIEIIVISNVSNDISPPLFTQKQKTAAYAEA